MNIFTKVRILLKVNEVVNKVKEQVMGKSLSVSTVLSVIMTVLQGVVQVGNLLPDKYKVWSLVAQIAAEFALKVQAAFHNPDGSPASVAYQPPPKN